MIATTAATATSAAASDRLRMCAAIITTVLVYAQGVRALGIDYGRRRIGLALSDATGLLARPWKTVAASGGSARIVAALAAEIDALASEPDGLSAVALGYPRRLNGEANEQTVAVEALATSLQQRVRVPIILQDERLSSREAESLLARGEKDWRKRKAQLDAASAAVILQDYLDAQPRAISFNSESDAP
jgi:putative holliday junction resolvase